MRMVAIRNTGNETGRNAFPHPALSGWEPKCGECRQRDARPSGVGSIAEQATYHCAHSTQRSGRECELHCRQWSPFELGSRTSISR